MSPSKLESDGFVFAGFHHELACSIQTTPSNDQATGNSELHREKPENRLEKKASMV